ncbi:hypothetical protein [Dyella humicola]|uniref:hypothetical protein n=1 Tax=Dyella humicola TaxID=2992126 RepID=UPI00225AD3AD|nr:hypothetical protein [Dyella humicola]
MLKPKIKDGRSNRKPKSHPFIQPVPGDEEANLKLLVEAAQALMGEIEGADWATNPWEITGGRLIEHPGKNIFRADLFFRSPEKRGFANITGPFEDLAKSLVALRFSRSNASLSNQRTFVTAVAYVAQEAAGYPVSGLRSTHLDAACAKIAEDYSKGVAYNMHKAVAEFASHCDANELCRVRLQYKYAAMVRPDGTTGFIGRRLDDPEATVRDEAKMATQALYRMLGALHQRVPVGHEGRLPLAILSILACTGFRFGEAVSLLVDCIRPGEGGGVGLRYFKGKAKFGRASTPLETRWLSGAMADIVCPIVQEMIAFCQAPRDVAREMRRVNGPDVRFLEALPEGARIGVLDLNELGIPPHGCVKWLQANRRWACAGTTAEDLIEYCRRDFHARFVELRFVDQHRKEYYLEHMLFCVPVYLSQMSSPAKWLSTGYSHAMLAGWIKRRLEPLAREFVPEFLTSIDFSSHAFRHTVNTLLDEGGLPELLQTDWFGRSNPRDTKAYQHTSKEKRVLEVRADLLSGKAHGRLADDLKKIPITLRESYVEAKVRAVHDVGPGACVHDFSQLPCERHLQCTGDCNDYVWAEDDEGRDEELKRQWSMAKIAQRTAEERSTGDRPRKSVDWNAHNAKKLKTLEEQLRLRAIEPFDPDAYLEEIAA